MTSGALPTAAPPAAALPAAALPAAAPRGGRSREVEEVLPSGARGRRLEITVAGEVHRLREEREAVFGSCQAALLGLPRVVVVHLVRRVLRRSR